MEPTEQDFMTSAINEIQEKMERINGKDEALQTIYSQLLDRGFAPDSVIMQTIKGAIRI